MHPSKSIVLLGPEVNKKIYKYYNLDRNINLLPKDSSERTSPDSSSYSYKISKSSISSTSMASL